MNMDSSSGSANHPAALRTGSRDGGSNIDSLIARRLLETCAGTTILVAGDLILDEYIWGRAERISPEAPVPVVLVERMETRLGGAANVAANVATLGCECRFAGAVGEDQAGVAAVELLRSYCIDTGPLLTSWTRGTTRKSRLMAGLQQLARMDWEQAADLTDDELERAMCSLGDAFSLKPLPGAAVISDYGKGFLSPEICRSIVNHSAEAGIPVVVDPKGRNWEKYSGAAVIKPNFKEFVEYCGTPCRISSELQKAMDLTRRQLNISAVMVTMGAEGMACLSEEGFTHIPASAREVFDVTGAGDTVTAVVAAILGSGGSMVEAMAVANAAAAVTVSRVGTHAPGIESIVAEIAGKTGHEKWLSRSMARSYCTKAREAGRRIVFTNGCFDLLSAGHVRFLQQARSLGDCLVVGLNGDDSVRRLKGADRPVIPLEQRAGIISALECVDRVVTFEEDTPVELLCELRPHLLVKGGNYAETEVVGAQQVRSWGGEVKVVYLPDAQSTSEFLKEIRTGK